MTQIGNGNTRHRVTLPDGTEVTLAWAAMTDTGLRREVNEDSFIAQARSSSTFTHEWSGRTSHGAKPASRIASR